MKRTFRAVLMGVCVGLFAACGAAEPPEQEAVSQAEQGVKEATACSMCGDGFCGACEGPGFCPEDCGPGPTCGAMS